jgi:hypothetical protein
MIFSPRRQDAQVQHKTVGEAIEVGDGATRYDWSIAFSLICMRLPCKDIRHVAAAVFAPSRMRSGQPCVGVVDGLDAAASIVRGLGLRARPRSHRKTSQLSCGRAAKAPSVAVNWLLGRFDSSAIVCASQID